MGWHFVFSHWGGNHYEQFLPSPRMISKEATADPNNNPWHFKVVSAKLASDKIPSTFFREDKCLETPHH